MVAAIDTTSGRSLFATFRQVAWHGLGTVFTEVVTDYRKMLSLAGLANRNVRFESLSTESGIVLDNQFATIGDMPDGTKRVYGVVGSRYEIVQNEDAFSFLQSLSDGARWETAGELLNGTVFGSLAFERESVLDPTGVADVVRTYALVFTDHGGNSALGYGLTPVRVVCKNTLNVALGNLKNGGKIRHTKSAEERMHAAAEMFRHANAYFDAFDEEAKALFAKPVTDKQYANVLTKVIGKAPEDNVKGRLSKWENKRDLYMQAWNGKPNAGIKGTAWGVFNALTEANQWGRNVQNTERGSENFYAAGTGFDIPTNVFRAQALSLAQSIR